MKKKSAIIKGCILAMAFLLLTACSDGQESNLTPSGDEGRESSKVEVSKEGQDIQESTSGAIDKTDSKEVTPVGPAADIVEHIVIGWNLGNTLDSYQGTQLGKNEGLGSETAWGNPQATQGLIDLVKDSGFNAVRVPVTWYNHMDSDYVIDEEWMDRVQEVVDYVINADLYCIINVHHDTGAEGWLKASDTELDQKKAMFTAIWEQISERFADYDDCLLFEGFNEILNDNKEWVNPDSRAVEITNELNQLFVDTVRSSRGNNAERVLVVNTYCAGGNSQVTAGFVLPTDTAENSLIVEAHVYQPYNFTAEEYPDTRTWSSGSIDSYLGNMYASFVKKGVPVIIGEFGCVDKDNNEERMSWAKYYLKVCGEYGIKCFWWDNGSAYRLFSRRDLKVAQKDLLGTLVFAAKGEEYIPQGEDEIEVTDNLCANVDNWTGWVHSSANATITYLPDGVSVEVTQAGEEEWYIQPTYTHVTLEQGVTYELSFDYAATAEMTVNHQFQQNYDPYKAYATGSADYTQEVQHYKITFTMMDETDDNVSLVFNCSKHKENVPYTITVTNLSLVKVGE